MNLLLIAVVAFLVLNAWLGMKRGLIKTVFAMFSFILTIVLTALLSPIVNKALQENEAVMDYFSEKVELLLPLEEIESKIEAGTKKVQAEFLQGLPLPDSILKTLEENNSKEFYKAFGVSSFADYLSRSIASMIVHSIAFAATFLVVFIFLKVLCISLDLVSKLPILNQINHLFGLAAGLAYAVIILWVGCILLMASAGTEFGGCLMKMVSESRLLSFIYNHNLLMSKITDLGKMFS